jgi:hypothetical protein
MASYPWKREAVFQPADDWLTYFIADAVTDPAQKCAILLTVCGTPTSCAVWFLMVAKLDMLSPTTTSETAQD